MSDDAPVQLTFEPQLSLKSSASTLSISHLNIKQKSYNALTRAGVNTISDLLRAVDAGITNIHSLGATSKNDIERSLTAILASIEKGGTVNWSTYCEHANISILPKEYGGGSGAQNIVSQFSSIVKEILCHKSDDERWRIVQRWFGLDRTEKLTSEALGKALGYSTSKIQNLRNSALTELREAFFEGNYVGKLYRIHPEIISAINFLFASLSLKDRDFILEADLTSAFSSYLNTNLPKHQSSLFLLLTVAGMTRITFGDSNLAPVWEYAETGQRDLLTSTLTHLDTLLTKDKAGPLDEFDILLSVNSRLLSLHKLTVLQLRKYLALCSTIEQRDDNLYWGKFEFLRGRGNQVERVLLENDRQMRMPEIVREINRRLVPKGERKVHQRTLTNQVSNDGRFLTIGKSGFWGLKTWGHIDTRSILELMERFLITLDRPATVDEIYNYIKERRPVSKNSIKFYLSMRDTFKEVDRRRWGLSTWPEAQNAKIWTPEEVAEFAVGIFREMRAKELEYRILKETLMDAAKVTGSQAASMLSISSVIETERRSSGGVRYAKLKEDYKSQINNRRYPFQRKTLTIFERVDDAVRKILEARPGNQIELSELVSKLQNEHGFLDKTIYMYVSRLEYLEKVNIPGSKTKLCRLKDAQNYDFRGTKKYSCFISYSSRDQSFSEKLHADLENRGVKCWLATEDLKIGDRFRNAIDESIRSHDKLLLVLSQHSVSSQWVEKEVETAMEREAEENQPVLFPVRLDGAVMEIQNGWPADVRRTRHIGDFTNWKDHDVYQRALDRLLLDLNAEEAR